MTACGAPQALDQRHLLDPAVRWFKQLPLADEHGAKAWAPAALAALAACWGSPEGPVHLNCPFREPLWAEGLETQARLGLEPFSPKRLTKGAIQMNRAFG